MSSSWGRNIKISIFGESHGPGTGVVLDGLPPGFALDESELHRFMKRRAPGQAVYSTPRKESDLVTIQSGWYQGKTTGTPLCGFIKNSNTRSQDYAEMPLRPSHGDYPGLLRYAESNDPRGGGHFSARLTAPLTFAGGIAKQILAAKGIVIGGHIASIGTVKDAVLSPVSVDPALLRAIGEKEFPVLDDAQGAAMKAVIEAARLEQDSVGGIVSCCAVGLPAGIGSPMFDGLENTIASLVFGIPAVRGLEFGTGFAATTLRGSEHNDPYYLEDGAIKTATNHHGGIIGGISSGMPILMQVAFKPTASISQEQRTVDWISKQETTLSIHGRHDPCVVPRAVPIVEACLALALLDSLLEGGNPVARDFSFGN